MENSEIIGYLASTCYVVSLFPEIYIVHKTNQCNLTMYFLLFQVLTTGLFISYDLLMDLMPLLIADCLLMVELFYLISYKFMTRNRIKIKEIKPNIRVSLV
jgi:hypothetical protein